MSLCSYTWQVELLPGPPGECLVSELVQSGFSVHSFQEVFFRRHVLDLDRHWAPRPFSLVFPTIPSLLEDPISHHLVFCQGSSSVMDFVPPLFSSAGASWSWLGFQLPDSCLRFEVRLLSAFLPSLPVQVLCESRHSSDLEGSSSLAPKRCIGGAGASAIEAPTPVRLDFCMGLLEFFSDALLPFFLAILGLTFLALVRMLLYPLPGRLSPLGRFCAAATGWVSLSILRPFGACCFPGGSGSLLGLDWSISGGHRSRRGKNRDTLCSARISPGSDTPQDSAANTTFHHLGYSLPRPVRCGIPGRWIFSAAFCAALHVQGTYAMTAPFEYIERDPDDLPLVPSTSSANFVGSTRVHSPWACEAVHSSPEVVALPPAPAVPDIDPSVPALGVQVLTPFFRPVYFAWCPTGRATVVDLMDAVRDQVDGVPNGMYPFVVPTIPQYLEGFASLVRAPQHVRREADSPSAVVVFDLRRVGGLLFAELVPFRVAYQDLEARIIPAIEPGTRTIRYFVGCGRQLCPIGADVEVRDGVVVTAVYDACESFHRGCIEDLLSADARWAPVQRMPRPDLVRGTYVIFGKQNFFIAENQQGGVGLAAAIARRLCRQLRSVTTCSFPTNDLGHKGFACDTVFFVADMPWPFHDDLHSQRRDFFTLCDARAIGIMPTVIHTHHPVLHLPSVLALIGARLSTNLRVSVIGGRRVADEIFIGGHSCILFYAVRGSDVASPCGDAHPGSDEESSPSRHGRFAGAREIWSDEEEIEDLSPCRARTITMSPRVVVATDGDSDSGHDMIDHDDSTILGVALCAPHYQTELLALRVAPTEGPDALVEKIRGLAQHVPLRQLDQISLVEPTPIRGFAALIAFSPVLAANANVAVLIDMSPVGGKRFAAVLPGTLGFDAWDRYIRALLPCEVRDYSIFLGLRVLPHPVGEALILGNGLLIAVCPPDTAQRDSLSHDQLFMDRNSWQDVAGLPQLVKPRSVCLLSQDGRFCMRRRDYPGCSFVQAAERCIGAPEGSITTAFATHPPMRDLCVHGVACRGLAMASHIPQPVPVPPATYRRDDNFLFLDFRPVGFRPLGAYQIGEFWRIDALLARFPFQLPAGYALSIVGGRIEGEYLVASSGSVLVFRLVVDAAAGACVVLEGHGPPQQEPDSEADTFPMPHASLSARPPRGPPPPQPCRTRSRSPRGTSAAFVMSCKALDHPVDTLTSRPLLAGGFPFCRSDGFREGFWLRRKPRLSILQLRGPTKRPPSAVLRTALLLDVDIHLGTFGPDPVGLSVGDACNFSTCALICPRLSLCDKVRTSKILTEPGTPHGESSLTIATLRYFAPRLGRPWRYMRPIGAFDLEDDAPDPDTLDAAYEEVRWVHFAIAAPGYVLEVVSFSLLLPTTPEEALLAVNAHRRPFMRESFPELIPADPQPLSGVGFVLAVPAWNSRAIWICADTSYVDGRVFAHEGPAYANKPQLQALVSLPPNLELSIFVGDSGEPLADEAFVQLSQGATIMFVPSGVGPVLPYSLGMNLQSPMLWDEVCTLPRIASDSAICVACPDECILFTIDPRQPFAYRRQIGACLGIPELRLSLTPASPKVRDAAPDGFPCRTVLAASEKEHGPPEGFCDVVLDARAIGLAWRSARIASLVPFSQLAGHMSFSLMRFPLDGVCS